ncbi:hypothetical protein JYG34_13120 [Pseudomonas entomophila]|uniref:hypothetical protein n=1 Tax=Pseudomonas entomophila TaxID=312306 RepID=UPI001BCCB31E|nr:hypothetical protein [Pseudomonas entomophila]QVM94098.1 hypothetical protein JYG34_13120 [Pseudomonas entomophila]
MNVYVERNTELKRWWVHMDDWRVGFNTAAEAEQFVERLTSRLNAPHSLDMLADGAPRTGFAAAHGTHTGARGQGSLRSAKEA